MNDRKNLLLALAVATNPLVWAAVCFGLAALVLYAIYAFCRAECRTPPRHQKPAAIDLDECEQLPEPAPVVQVDENGRPEIYVPEPLFSVEKARPVAIEVVTTANAPAVCPQAAKPEAVCARKTSARPKGRSKPKARPTGRKAKKAAGGVK
jgi:hypothetical protein